MSRLCPVGCPQHGRVLGTIELCTEMGFPYPFCPPTPDFVEGWLRPREGKLAASRSHSSRQRASSQNSLFGKGSSKAPPQTALGCQHYLPCPVSLGASAGVLDENFMTSFQIMQLDTVCLVVA